MLYYFVYIVDTMIDLMNSQKLKIKDNNMNRNALTPKHHSTLGDRVKFQNAYRK